MDVLTELVIFFGFWPVLISGLLAYWLGKKSGLLACVGASLGILVFIVSAALGLGPSGRDGGFLVFAAYAVFGLLFAGVATVSYLYHSGVLGKIFTPKSGKN